MATKLYKKHPVERDVYALARERIRVCFDEFDTVSVSFSGGKDSTACLQLTLDVAREKKRLPLEVFFFDEEAIPPETVEYMERVAANPDVKLLWLASQIKHRNAASRRSPWWLCWDSDQKDKWCREFPALGVDDLRLKGIAIPESNGVLYGPDRGRVCVIMGIRTQESLNRYMAIANSKTGHRAFLSGDVSKWLTRSYPIYDWAHEDIWLAPERFGWDFNRAYDVMGKAGVPIAHQRCAPPYGEQPLERLWTYKICWPELWAKMCYRVPGAPTAARYARTALYGYGKLADVKHPDMSWRDFILNKLQSFSAKDRATCATYITELLEEHKKKTRDPLPDGAPHPESGLCWQDVAQVALRGDLKGGRKKIAILAKAHSRAEKTSTRHHGES